jgi:hypothetical protein
MTPYRLVNSNRFIGGIILPKLPNSFWGAVQTLKMKNVASSETSLNLCYSTWRRLKDDLSLPYVISRFIDFCFNVRVVIERCPIIFHSTLISDGEEPAVHKQHFPQLHTNNKYFLAI